MSVSTRTGNRRLLKLADYLEELPRGTYNQDSAGGKAKCAMAHTWDLPAYKQFSTTAEKNDESSSTTIFYALESSDDYMALFGRYGCQQKDGQPAKTGKQAAKFIRAFVDKREAT